MKNTIITVTPNVAIDQTITLKHLVPGSVHRSESVSYNAGGKGVNVSSCLADWGLPSFATGFLGDKNASLFESLCREKGITDCFVRVNGLSRTNIKLVDEKDTTDINLPGPAIDREALAGLRMALERPLSGQTGVAVLSGSLPCGCPENIFALMTERLCHHGYKVILDVSGPSLRSALTSYTLPYCIKPNRSELSEWSGRELTDTCSLIKEGRELLRRGISLVVVSLGQDGALFLSGKKVLLAKGEAKNIVSTVGAGDAMVAGITAAICKNATLERIARLGTAFSVSKLGILGPNLPERSLVEQTAEQVTVTEVIL